MAKFKNPRLRTTYETCRRLAAEGREAEIRGDTADAYWRGRQLDEENPGYARGSFKYAAWAAGRDDRRGLQPLKP